MSSATVPEAFLPNQYAVCECELAQFPADEFPICTFFEAVEEEDAYDCCKACRHGADCHLKGHAPLEAVRGAA